MDLYHISQKKKGKRKRGRKHEKGKNEGKEPEKEGGRKEDWNGGGIKKGLHKPSVCTMNLQRMHCSYLITEIKRSLPCCLS